MPERWIRGSLSTNASLTLVAKWKGNGKVLKIVIKKFPNVHFEFKTSE